MTFEEIQATQDGVSRDLCRALGTTEARRLGVAGVKGDIENIGFHVSCGFEGVDSAVEIRVGIDGASVQAPHFDEVGATAVEVAGADRAAVIDDPLYRSDRGPIGFTVIADDGNDLVQVVVAGVRRNDARQAAAIEVTEAALALPRG